MKETYQSEYGVLKSVLLKHPREAYVNEESIENQWQQLQYFSKPDLNKANDEYETLVGILYDRDIEVNFLPENNETGLDSVYVRDASIVTNNGILICNMGKGQRKGEPGKQRDFYLSNDLRILGKVNGDATVEGGDVAWLDEQTLAVARGYRTNDEGIHQLRGFLDDSIELIVVPSPHYKGPSDVFHLMSVYSPVDKDLAVVYSPLMTVPFRQELIRRGIKFVEVPDNEFESMGCNVLALAPGVCLMISGNPVTKSLLEAAGAEVIVYKGEEISLKGNGGPTCLTRPLVREV